MNKRLFSVFLVVLLLALAVTSSVSAQGPVVSRLATVSVGSYDVAVGDTFTVPVTITGVSNLYGADVKLVFDNTVLQADLHGCPVGKRSWLDGQPALRQKRR